MTAADGPAPGALVVVAHPDDEILWLMPAVPLASRIVAALPLTARASLNEGRAKVRGLYPLPGMKWLPLTSPGVHRASDWSRRRPTGYGVELADHCDPGKDRSYRANYALMLEQLAPYVQACSEVFTHNPWGEYGHEEHVQVSNAVVELACRYGRAAWGWDGFGERQLLREGTRLRRDYYHRSAASAPRRDLQADLDLYRQIRRLYLENDAWTWHAGYEPPSVSTYIALADGGERLVGPSPRRPVLWAWRAASTRGRLAVCRRAALAKSRSARTARRGPATTD